MMIKRNAKWLSDVVGGKLNAIDSIEFNGVSIDSRKIDQGVLFIPFKGENVDGHKYVQQALESGAALALWQQDVPLPEGLSVIVVEDTLTALQQMAKAYLNEVAPKVIAVTGSNGKTTTKDMIEAVLKSNFKVKKTQGNYNNEIGLPLTICQLDEDTEISILEMGMSGFGEIEFLSRLAEPSIAAITNIGESHMRDLGSREGIAKAKFEITAGLNGPLLFDGDEPLLKTLVDQYKGEVLSIGFNESNDLYIHHLVALAQSIEFDINNTSYSVPTLGAHNARNATIAIQIGKILGLSDETIQQNIQSLSLTGMRMERIQGINGSLLINDAYNASPTSMKAAIDTVSQMQQSRKIIVLSDVLELGPDEERYHREVGRYFEDQGIDLLLTYGKAAQYISDEAQQFTEAKHFETKEAIAAYLSQILDHQTACLFKASRGMALETIITSLK